MTACSFCGHENAGDARSCVACGHVFSGEGSAPSSGADTAHLGHLASLYDPDPVDKAARQAAILSALAAVLALAVAVGAVVATADAIGELGEGETVFFSTADVADVAGRADVLTLAEHSLFAGVLVIFGGWAQTVGASRSLLGVDDPERDASAMLRAFVVLGPNVVTAGRAVRELWSDSAPPGEPAGDTPLVVRWFGGIFGAAVVTRVASMVWGYLFAPAPTTDGRALVAGVVVTGTRLIWIGALGAGILATRAVGQRQRRRARVLTEGADPSPPA